MTKDERAYDGCLAACVALIAMIPLSALKAVVARALWGWFAVPILGVRPVSFWEMFGLSTLVVYLVYQYQEDPPTERSQTEKAIGRIAFSVVWSLMALGIGAFAHSMTGH